MIYIDINTKETYNGDMPYVHWFQQEMSIDLIYTHKICFLHQKPSLQLSLDSNIFNILNINNGTTYNDIKCQKMTANGIKCGNQYIYIIYFSASSTDENQYTTTVSIISDLGTEYLMIGADFYGPNESLYVNLSNMGVELPSQVQKSIYTSNIKEDKTDHILLNRKMKELMSNYWDVIANRGSYKSLLNSLKWFEWGDLIKIKEIWKRENFGQIIYDDKSIQSVMENKYNEYFNFTKTTSLAIYLTAQKILDTYDSEFNPNLENIVLNWAKEDVMIKLCLLGLFYETYFMPIHLELSRSTMENIVFTNTIKLVNSTLQSRFDYIYDYNNVKCNIKNGQEFILSNVKCYVDDNTFFKSEYSNETIGVSIEEANKVTDTDMSRFTFYNQYHNGVGCVVEFEVDLPESIIESICTINNISTKDYTIFTGIKRFNILFKKEGTYDISLDFKSGTSKHYIKQLQIKVLDVNGMGIKLYKIKKKINRFWEKDGIDFNTFGFSRTNNPVSHYIRQYIPTSKDPYNENGVAMNHVLILEGDWNDDAALNKYYNIYINGISNTYIDTNHITDIIDLNKFENYTICISKDFWLDPEIVLENFIAVYGKYIYKNEYGFFPCNHYLKELDGDNINDYTIYNDALVAVPDLPYGLTIDECSWEFINNTIGTSFSLPDFQTPIIANEDKVLEPGYYDIIFKYRIGEKIHELKLDSAFIQL